MAVQPAACIINTTRSGSCQPRGRIITVLCNAEISSVWGEKRLLVPQNLSSTEGGCAPSQARGLPGAVPSEKVLRVAGPCSPFLPLAHAETTVGCHWAKATLPLA